MAQTADLAAVLIAQIGFNGPDLGFDGVQILGGKVLLVLLHLALDTGIEVVLGGVFLIVFCRILKGSIGGGNLIHGVTHPVHLGQHAVQRGANGANHIGQILVPFGHMLFRGHFLGAALIVLDGLGGGTDIFAYLLAGIFQLVVIRLRLLLKGGDYLFICLGEKHPALLHRQGVAAELLPFLPLGLPVGFQGEDGLTQLLHVLAKAAVLAEQVGQGIGIHGTQLGHRALHPAQVKTVEGIVQVGTGVGQGVVVIERFGGHAGHLEGIIALALVLGTLLVLADIGQVVHCDSVGQLLPDDLVRLFQAGADGVQAAGVEAVTHGQVLRQQLVQMHDGVIKPLGFLRQGGHLLVGGHLLLQDLGLLPYLLEYAQGVQQAHADVGRAPVFHKFHDLALQNLRVGQAAARQSASREIAVFYVNKIAGHILRTGQAQQVLTAVYHRLAQLAVRVHGLHQFAGVEAVPEIALQAQVVVLGGLAHGVQAVYVGQDAVIIGQRGVYRQLASALHRRDGQVQIAVVHQNADQP